MKGFASARSYSDQDNFESVQTPKKLFKYALDI